MVVVAATNLVVGEPTTQARAMAQEVLKIAERKVRRVKMRPFSTHHVSHRIVYLAPPPVTTR